MRKTDKAAKQNKPSKSKVEGGGVGTLKQSKEEINNAEIQLEIAKKLAKGKGVVFLKQGYSRESEKMKAEVTARKNKKNKLAD